MPRQSYSRMLFHRNYAAAGVDPAVMVLSLMTLTSLKYA